MICQFEADLQLCKMTGGKYFVAQNNFGCSDVHWQGIGKYIIFLGVQVYILIRNYQAELGKYILAILDMICWTCGYNDVSYKKALAIYIRVIGWFGISFSSFYFMYANN